MERDEKPPVNDAMWASIWKADGSTESFSGWEDGRAFVSVRSRQGSVSVHIWADDDEGCVMCMVQVAPTMTTFPKAHTLYRGPLADLAIGWEDLGPG